MENAGQTKNETNFQSLQQGRDGSGGLGSGDEIQQLIDEAISGSLDNG